MKHSELYGPAMTLGLAAAGAEHADAASNAVLTSNLGAPFRLARALGRRMLAPGTGPARCQ